METKVTQTGAGQERPLILIAEDAGVQVRLAQLCLERAGYRVAAAPNGAVALEAVERERPELILLDVDMPELNGFQVLDRLRGRPETRDIPVVMLTAHSKDAALFAEWARPTDAFMAKPFSPEQLVTTVRQVLAALVRTDSALPEAGETPADAVSASA